MEKCSFKNRKKIVGKGENAGIQQFLLFQKCFQKFSLSNKTNELNVSSDLPVSGLIEQLPPYGGRLVTKVYSVNAGVWPYSVTSSLTL